MRCSDFHNRINHLLDERLELSQDPAITQHADSCETCGRDLQNYQILVTQEVTAVSNGQHSTQRSTPTLWLMIAASLLLAITFFPRNEQTQTSLLQSEVVMEPIDIVEDAKLTLVDPIGDQQTISTQGNGASGHFVQPIISIGYIANAVQPVEMPFSVPVPTVEANWLNVVADEMVPIQESVNSTVDLIVRTLSTSA